MCDWKWDVSGNLKSGKLCVPIFSKFLHFFGDRSSVIFLSKSFLIIKLIWISRIIFDPRDSRKLFGLTTCGSCLAGFRHSAGFHARVILDGAACRLGEPGDVHDVLGVRVVPIVLRVLVSW